MSRKISDFFNKTSIKIESIMEESNEGENSGRINENVKSEAEKQLLVILPQQKIQKFPVPIKIEDNEPKIDSFQCQDCNKIFNNISSLRIHKNIHNKRFGCQICSKKFPIKYKLIEHIKNIHEKSRRFKCEVCNVGFNTKAHLTKHQRTHMKNRPKPFKCDKCDFATDSISSLNGHLKTHERIYERCEKCNKKLFKSRIHDCRLDCKYCGKKFSHKATVTNHIKRYHEQETKGCFYECDICGLKFIQKKYLKSHMVKKHVEEEIPIFTCDLDGKTFGFKNLLNKHMKSHQPPVKCDFCHIKVNKSYLKKHIKNSHTGIKQPRKKFIPKIKSFQCPICFKILSTKHCLKRHISDHNKTVKCKFCEKLFGSKSNLNTHIRNYHENHERHICNICDHESTLRSNLKTHMKTHDSNRTRNLKCSQCDFATFSKQSFQTHLNFHKKNDAEVAAMRNPHKCPQCPAIKRSKIALNKHIYSVHPKFLFECDICGKIIKVKAGLLPHFRGLHKIKP